MFIKFVHWLVGFTYLCAIVTSLALPTGTMNVSSSDLSLIDTEPRIPLNTTEILEPGIHCLGFSFHEPSVLDCLAAIKNIYSTPNASVERTWSPTAIFIPSIFRLCQISLIPLSPESKDVITFTSIGNTAADIVWKCTQGIFGRDTQGGRQVVGLKQMFYVSVGFREPYAR